MTVAAPVNADDFRRLDQLLTQLGQLRERDKDELARQHGSIFRAEARDEMRRLDDLDDAIRFHRDSICAVRPEDCHLLVPHLAHYAKELTA